jgi:hypothetical protein
VSSVAAAASAPTSPGTNVLLRQPLPLLPPPPTMATKARVRARGRGKARTTGLATTATGAATPQRRPPSTIPRPAPSRCGQGCALLISRCVHHSTPCLLHRHTMVPPVTLCPCRCLHCTNSRSRHLPGHPRSTHGINSHWPTPLAPWPPTGSQTPVLPTTPPRMPAT